MRNLAVLLVFIAFTQTLFTAFTFSDEGCNAYFPITQGAEFELTSYNPKDKMQSRAVYQVTDRKETPEGIEAEVHFRVFDDKDKLVQENYNTMQCKAGIFYIDMKNMVNPEMTKAFKDMEAKVTSTLLEYPQEIKTGDKLKDGNITIEMLSNGNVFGSITMDVKNRKVTGKEEITVPAGKFSAYIIEYDVDMKTKMGVTIPSEMKVKEWLAKDAGVVRSETYNKTGKLVSYTLLTKLKL